MSSCRINDFHRKVVNGPFVKISASSLSCARTEWKMNCPNVILSKANNQSQHDGCVRVSSSSGFVL